MAKTTAFLAIGAVIMAGAIIYALTLGAFFEEARVLFVSPWFQLSLIDLYVGFFLFSGWIAYRERRRPVAALWIVIILLLGNLAACLYALLAVRKARGDWRAFWLGDRLDARP